MAVSGTQNLVKTQKELAAELRTTERTICRLKAAGMPQLDGGGWDVDACRSWKRRRTSRARRRSRMGIPQADIDALDAEDREEFDEIFDLSGSNLDEASIKAQTRYRLIKSEREELLLKKERGDLVDKAECEREFCQWGSGLMRRMMDLGRTTCHLLQHETELSKIQSIIENDVRLVFEEVSSTGFIDKEGRLVLVVVPKKGSDIEAIGADLERLAGELGCETEARFATDRTPEFSAGDYRTHTSPEEGQTQHDDRTIS